MGHLSDTKAYLEIGQDLSGAVPTEVEFGSPATKDCLRIGICRIHLFPGARPNLLPPCCPDRAFAFMRYWENTGVELIFPVGNMASATLEKHFGTGHFYIEEPYHLPTGLAARLDLNGFTFLPGRYPVLKSPGRLHLLFEKTG